jgi:hypothetical protein
VAHLAAEHRGARGGQRLVEAALALQVGRRLLQPREKRDALVAAASSSSATMRPPSRLSEVTELVVWRAKALMSGTRLNSTTGTPESAHWRARSGDSMAEAMTMPSI